MPKISKVTKRVRAMRIITGIEAYFEAKKSYVVYGNRTTRAQLLATFRAHLAAIDKADAAYAAFLAAVADERKLARKAEVLARDVKAFVHAAKGAAPAVYASFGWAVPKKPGPKTLASKVAGIAKRKKSAKP